NGLANSNRDEMTHLGGPLSWSVGQKIGWHTITMTTYCMQFRTSMTHIGSNWWQKKRLFYPNSHWMPAKLEEARHLSVICQSPGSTGCSRTLILSGRYPLLSNRMSAKYTRKHNT